ncbi:MAG TPA: D-aminoacyl-tRNA deacylase [bacterium]|nr:D-aminoacyl-tRNA deacylase [bacterium]
MFALSIGYLAGYRGRMLLDTIWMRALDATAYEIQEYLQRAMKKGWIRYRESGGMMLLVPQFTLCADTRKGNRPGFSEAAAPEIAEPLFTALADAVQAAGVPVVTGFFRQHMQVEITNDGPVTFIIDAVDTNSRIQ